MAKARDIKQENNDLFINESGDFEAVFSDVQHVEDIVSSAPGWWKRTPTVGVNILLFLAGAASSFQRLVRQIKIQLGADGYRIDKVKEVNNQIYISGERNVEI